MKPDLQKITQRIAALLSGYGMPRENAAERARNIVAACQYGIECKWTDIAEMLDNELYGRIDDELTRRQAASEAICIYLMHTCETREELVFRIKRQVGYGNYHAVNWVDTHATAESGVYRVN